MVTTGRGALHSFPFYHPFTPGFEPLQRNFLLTILSSIYRTKRLSIMICYDQVDIVFFF